MLVSCVRRPQFSFLHSTGKSKKTKKGVTSAEPEVPEASDVEEVEVDSQPAQKVRSLK